MGLPGEETPTQDRPRGPWSCPCLVYQLVFAHFGGTRRSLSFWVLGVGDGLADTMNSTVRSLDFGLGPFTEVEPAGEHNMGEKIWGLAKVSERWGRWVCRCGAQERGLKQVEMGTQHLCVPPGGHGWW